MERHDNKDLDAEWLSIIEGTWKQDYRKSQVKKHAPAVLLLVLLIGLWFATFITQHVIPLTFAITAMFLGIPAVITWYIHGAEQGKFMENPKKYTDPSP